MTIMNDLSNHHHSPEGKKQKNFAPGDRDEGHDKSQTKYSYIKTKTIVKTKTSTESKGQEESWPGDQALTAALRRGAVRLPASEKDF